jgi:hypothetical protein
MKKLFCGLTLFLALLVALGWTFPASAAPSFTMDTKFFTPPPGMATIGDSHGDIALTPKGEVYVSVQGGEYPGIQVYSAQGKYLRNIPGAPPDLHGFIIARAPDRKFYIYGVSRLAQQIVQMTLDGRNVLTIPASAIPDQYKKKEAQAINLTGIAVAPNGDIYVTDGYGLDYIHHFDKTGRYLGTFGGKAEPYAFDTCHKLAIDTRFTPLRLLCTDRKHNRLVHMGLDGHVIGVFAQDLRLPSALSIHGDELAVAELEGRVTILDRDGEVLTHVGTNDNKDEVHTNKTPPTVWKPDRFYAPHGLVYDPAGNLYVTEFNEFGRVTFLKRQ